VPSRYRKLVFAVLRWTFLVVGGGYLVWIFGVQGYRYLDLKLSIREARSGLVNARWKDVELRCPNNLKAGAQIEHLFRKPEIYVTRILWDQRPPRFELYITGMASPRPDVEPRHLLLTVELDPVGGATLTDAVLAGEQGQLENGRILLKAACSAPAATISAIDRAVRSRGS